MSDMPNTKSDFDTSAAVKGAEGNPGYHHTLATKTNGSQLSQ